MNVYHNSFYFHGCCLCHECHKSRSQFECTGWSMRQSSQHWLLQIGLLWMVTLLNLVLYGKLCNISKCVSETCGLYVQEIAQSYQSDGYETNSSTKSTAVFVVLGSITGTSLPLTIFWWSSNRRKDIHWNEQKFISMLSKPLCEAAGCNTTCMQKVGVLAA